MRNARSMATICRFGGDIGWGHVTRCAALNSEARSRGWQTRLLTPDDPSSLPEEHARAFDAVLRLPGLRLSGSEDEIGSVDILLIDERDCPDSLFDEAKACVDAIRPGILIAIDDAQMRGLAAADLVVNPELGLRSASYASRHCLLGERYAPIRRGFRDSTEAPFPEDKSLLPVFIMLGGTDPKGLTEAVLDAMASYAKEAFAPIVVSGDGSVRHRLETKLSVFNESLYEQRLNSEQLSTLIAASSFGIIGCGSSAYELAALNKPFVGLLLAENQIRMAGAIEESWNLPVVSAANGGRFEDELAEGFAAMAAMHEAGRDADFGNVDFDGAKRVLERIEAILDRG